MNMDPSCKAVKVTEENVVCVSDSGNTTIVGTLGKLAPQSEDWQWMFHVNWNDNVEILKTLNFKGQPGYSLRVKN